METFLHNLLSRVQELLQTAVDGVFPHNSWEVPLPTVFGSHRYGLSGKTSDVDLCVVAPPAVVERGDDVRALLAKNSL